MKHEKYDCLSYLFSNLKWCRSLNHLFWETRNEIYNNLSPNVAFVHWFHYVENTSLQITLSHVIRGTATNSQNVFVHDDVIKWKYFPRNWPFVREIHRSPVNFPHKGQWRGALMFSLIYAWINDWVNNREAGDLRRQHGHYDVIVMVHIDSRKLYKKKANRVTSHHEIDFIGYRVSFMWEDFNCPPGLGATNAILG